ncbi:MAG: PaaI family thioesterase [Alphaproteobacteria bacterium]|nr:PaaI family thioesterase [Alphaproteobacteria bacterium]
MSRKPVAFDPHMIELMVHQGIPHCRELGVRVVEVGAARTVLMLPFQERLIGNPEFGILAGGVVTTLVDTVCGMAVQVALGKLLPIATLDLRIDYLRPSEPRQDVHAMAECYKLTRQIAFVRSTAWNEDEAKPIANCVATFMIGSSDKAVLPPSAEQEAGRAVKGARPR